MSIGHILIAGIGNQPFPFTRHSIGHVLIDSLAQRLGVNFSSTRTGYVAQQDILIGENSVRLTLLKTKAPMNLSGPPVAAQLRTAGIPSLSLVVIHDSLSHRPLVVSPKFGGSANGHNGVRSIIAALGNNPDFHRIRVGIGKNDGQDAADYVMAKLSEAERNFWSHGGKGVDHVWKHIETIAQSASR